MTDELERDEVIVGGISDAFYGRPEEGDRVYFTPQDAIAMMRAEAILQALMETGVHEWEYFEDAMQKFREGWKQ